MPHVELSDSDLTQLRVVKSEAMQAMEAAKDALDRLGKGRRVTTDHVTNHVMNMACALKRLRGLVLQPQTDWDVYIRNVRANTCEAAKTHDPEKAEDDRTYRDGLQLRPGRGLPAALTELIGALGELLCVLPKTDDEASA